MYFYASARAKIVIFVDYIEGLIITFANICVIYVKLSDDCP